MNLITPLQIVHKNEESYLWYIGKVHTHTETYYQGVLQTFWDPISEYCSHSKVLKHTKKRKQLRDVFKEIKEQRF